MGRLQCHGRGMFERMLLCTWMCSAGMSKPSEISIIALI